LSSVVQIILSADMAVPFSNSRMRIPHGFQGLLEGMAKEVLMVQPPDIYTFSATYFENLLKKRDGNHTVIAFVAILKVFAVCNRLLGNKWTSKLS